MARARNIVFRIFYSTSFTIVFLVLIAFICISPADVLYRSYQRRRIVDIFIIAGVYIVTALVALLIYASRLYTTRSVLKDIPKTYVPLDKEELPGSKMWRLISDVNRRSAVVGFLCRPRAWRVELEDDGEGNGDGDGGERVRERLGRLLRPELRKGNNSTFGEGMDVKEIGGDGRWGSIKHRGWSSPASVELPDLQYETVVSELADLVEAKVVSLAPVNRTSRTPLGDVDGNGNGGGDEDGLPVPDERVIEALTRPDNMGMRGYVARLIELNIVEAGELTTAFLTLYERARFAVEPLAEHEFQALMRLFADFLRAVKPVNLDLLGLDSDNYNSEEDVDGGRGGGRERDRDEADARSIATKSSRRSRTSFASSISGSVRHYRTSSRRSSDEGSVRVRSKGEG